jgi:HEAT repeat protein
MILARLTRPENLKGLLSSERFDASGLEHLLPRLSLEAYDPLLEALSSSPSRIVRRRLLDLLGRTPVDISPLIIARLTDERWYVQRNMLTLLARSRNLPQSFSVMPWTHHADPRVRSEAIRLQLLLPHERDVAVDAALNDADPRIVHLGLTAMGDTASPRLLDRVIDLALTSDLGEDTRLLAVNSLTRARRADVLDALLQLSGGGRSIFGRIRLLSKTPVLVAVIRALATTWADEPRASGVLAAAARSSDPDLRQAVSAPR